MSERIKFACLEELLSWARTNIDLILAHADLEFERSQLVDDYCDLILELDSNPEGDELVTVGDLDDVTFHYEPELPDDPRLHDLRDRFSATNRAIDETVERLRSKLGAQRPVCPVGVFSEAQSRIIGTILNSADWKKSPPTLSLSGLARSAFDHARPLSEQRNAIKQAIYKLNMKFLKFGLPTTLSIKGDKLIVERWHYWATDESYRNW